MTKPKQVYTLKSQRDYITNGKVYDVVEWIDDSRFKIIDDDGDIINFCFWVKHCNHGCTWLDATDLPQKDGFVVLGEQKPTAGPVSALTKEQALDALRNGHRVRSITWPVGAYASFDENRLACFDEKGRLFNFFATDHTIFTIVPAETEKLTNDEAIKYMQAMKRSFFHDGKTISDDHLIEFGRDCYETLDRVEEAQ